MEKIQETLDALLGRFDQLSGDVEHLKQKAVDQETRGLEEEVGGADHHRSRSRSASERPINTLSGRATSRKRSWYDRMEDDPEERPDYEESVSWPDEEPDNSKTVEVSKKTERFLEECCSRSLPYSTRTQLRDESGGVPKVPSTKTPKLDEFLKSELSASCKSLDKDLTRVQHHILDALAPLTAIIEASEKDERISLEDVLKTVKSACRLIGNANCKMSQLRREKAVLDFNKSLLPVVRETDFKSASPNLFGPEFARQSKEYVEQVRAMRSSLSKPKPHTQQSRRFFQNGPPAKRGGNYYQNRGRDSGWPRRNANQYKTTGRKDQNRT